MKQSRFPFWLVGSILSLSFVAARGQAQIVPDATLPNNSIVTPNGNTSIIEGGTTAGGNLFHSFREFSIPTGSTGFFNNALDIQNIFTRVTGGSISNIDGLIKANGAANLFLLNPNGIIFGPNAQLNIGGSFIGSTASSIRFADGVEFSAINPTATPLLTINVPVGLQFGSNPGSIINQSQAISINQSQAISATPLPPIDPRIPIPGNVGLQVLPGQSLALIGGDLSLNGGNLTAFGGNILLGSVASPGLVGFIPTPTGLGLDYTGIANFGNIELSGTASVTASGLGGGAIALLGGNVTLRDRSHLVSDTLGTINGRDITIKATQLRILDQAFVSAGTIGTGAGGNVTITAADFVELVGIGFENLRRIAFDPATNLTVDFSTTRQSGIVVGTVGEGSAGNITINTSHLALREGAQIGNITLGNRAGGNIAIKASESMEVNASGTYAPAFNQGNAGTLTIDTRRLTVRDGAVITTSTFGAGKGGNIIVTASDSIVVSGNRADSPFSTGIVTNTIVGSGKAGDIEINTRSLSIEEGASISSSSGLAATNRLIPAIGAGGNLTINASEEVRVIGASGEDRASRSLLATGTVGFGDFSASGNLTINTRRLIVQNAGVGASTLGEAPGGNVFINASESVEISKTSDNPNSAFGIATASGDLLYQLEFEIPPPRGKAGDITITTPRLTVQNGAAVSVASLGSGRAGTINVVADAIALDNQGFIDGFTGSGAGANINLQAQNIQLRQGSRIRTDAGTSDGGNITINTSTLAALEDSDITANALQGQGGRVTINASGIFGIEFRSRQTPNSDITATGGTPALSGVVEIRTTNNNVENAIAPADNNFANTDVVLATSCIARSRAGNSFTVTGNGGLPPTPYDPLMGRYPVAQVQGIGGRGESVEADFTDNLSRRQTTELNPPSSQEYETTPNSWKEGDPIVEARGFVVTADGQTRLVSGGQMRSLANADDFICR